MFAFLTLLTLKMLIRIKNVQYEFDLRGNVVRLKKVLLISFAYVTSQTFMIHRAVSPFHRAKHPVAVDDASSVVLHSNPPKTDYSYGVLLTTL